MTHRWIKNWDKVAISQERALVLKIAEAGLDAIDTETVIQNNVRLSNNRLVIAGRQFNLADFKNVYVLGFGKASGKAALIFEGIAGTIVTAGIIISNKLEPCEKIQVLLGTHPLPSLQNVEAAKKMAALIEQITEQDLVICLISGGGSALLCWDEEEYRQGTQLYENYLKTGQDIVGLNTVRKHISKIKGGGLAKLLYPATVVGLIFSDIAGGRDNLVDSGPTFLDNSTMYDAKAIVEKYDLGSFRLHETPKEDKYFEKVTNITLVSNTTALLAMKRRAETLGLKTVILSSEMYFTPEQTVKKLTTAAKKTTLLLAGGEIDLAVTKDGHSGGGRNSYLPLYALPFLQTDDVFASVASDGLDNGEFAGAIVDATTKQRIKHFGLNAQEALENFQSFELLQQLGSELIYTGPTEANVSDFLLYYRP